MAREMDNRRGGTRRSNPRREGRAQAAERHVADVAARCAREIERSIEGTVEIDGMPPEAAEALAKARAASTAASGKVQIAGAGSEVAAAGSEDVAAEPKPAPAEDTAAAEAASDVASEVEVAAAEGVSAIAGDDSSASAEGVPVTETAPASELPTVTVVDATSTQAVLDNGRGYAQFCDLALLDFASFVSPGGGYIRGAMAQEECLCADSFLYNVLKEKRAWYQENRRRNINCELYRNRGLIVPAVRFERNKMHAYADVLVVAAPFARRAREDYKVTDAQLNDALRERIRFALALCDKTGHDKLVAGAFGCGAFGNDPEVVAEMFREELGSGNWGVKQVIFAVPKNKWDNNLAVFEHAFATFPQKNPESFADAQARVAAAKAAEEAARATETEEDEDDWRKYL